MKKFVIILLIVVSLLTFSSGITYSFFHSNSLISMDDQHLAKLVFNSEEMDSFELPLHDLNPAEVASYDFSVKNYDSNSISNVAIKYQITIKTYHVLPLEIKLYKSSDDSLIINCTEAYSRNSDNEIVCNSDPQTLGHTILAEELYNLEISFIEGYESQIYANKVDFIDIAITSWQDTGV